MNPTSKAPRRTLPDGRVIEIIPLLFGAARLGVGTMASYETEDYWNQSFDDVWDYATFEAAVKAATAWDGKGDPEGWTRHPRTGRRRPDGNAALEFVRP